MVVSEQHGPPARPVRSARRHRPRPEERPRRDAARVAGSPSRPRSASSWPSCGGAPARRRGGSGRRYRRPPGVARPGARWAALGAALRLWQYAAGASLWADEANMALNIVERPLARLLGPLDYRQVAPPGWLVLEKLAVLALRRGRARASPGPAPREPRGAAARLARRAARASSGPRPAARPRAPGDGDPTHLLRRPGEAILDGRGGRAPAGRPGPRGRAATARDRGGRFAWASPASIAPWLSYPATLVAAGAPRGDGRDGAPGRATAPACGRSCRRHWRARRARSAPCSGRGAP